MAICKLDKRLFGRASVAEPDIPVANQKHCGTTEADIFRADNGYVLDRSSIDNQTPISSTRYCLSSSIYSIITSPAHRLYIQVLSRSSVAIISIGHIRLQSATPVYTLRLSLSFLPNKRHLPPTQRHVLRSTPFVFTCKQYSDFQHGIYKYKTISTYKNIIIATTATTTSSAFITCGIPHTQTNTAPVRFTIKAAEQPIN